jgi:hypothetical protein
MFNNIKEIMKFLCYFKLKEFLLGLISKDISESYLK